MKKMTPAGRRAVMGKAAPGGKRIEYRSILTTDPRLAEIDRLIAELEAQLAPLPGNDPAKFPLFKKMSTLNNKRRELLAQQGGRR